MNQWLEIEAKAACGFPGGDSCRLISVANETAMHNFARCMRDPLNRQEIILQAAIFWRGAMTATVKLRDATNFGC